MTDTPTDPPEAPPALQVLRGSPTPEELAALIAVVTTRSAPPTPAPEPDRASDWATYWRHAHRPLHPGPGRWRASAHP